jgi:hypothetical protein
MQSLKLIVLLLLVGFSIHADSRRRDRNWWLAQSPNSQSLHMIGVLDGTDLGNRLSYEALLEKKGEDGGHAIRTLSDAYDGVWTRYIGHVTSGRICDGLTEFYKDYRNRHINIPNAVWMVLNMISGKSADEMRSMIEHFRKFPDQ